MQKKVIAAVLGGLLISPAVLADVNISGRLSAGIESYKLSGGTRTYSNEMRMSDQSSSVVFSGSEDLGGGMSAWFKIDNRFNFPDASASWSPSGNTQIGLKGGFGSIGIGRADLHYMEMFRYDAQASGSLQSWVTGSVFSQVQGLPIANTTRWPNVLKWDNSFGNGASVTLAYSTSGAGSPGNATEEGTGIGTPNPGKGNAYDATLRYGSGPLSVGASVFNATPEDGNTADTGKQQSSRVWVGYTFGMFHVALGYDKSKVTGTGERSAWALPISIVNGADTFSIKYASAGDLDQTTGGTLSNSGASISSVGWDHALSKATHIGVFYTALTNKDNGSYQFFANAASSHTNAATGEDAKQIYAGIAHFY